MRGGTNSHARWLRAAVSAGCTAALLLAGAHVGGRSEPVTHTAAFRQTPPPGRTVPGYAGRSRVFGLVTPGSDCGQVLFAPADRMQPAGPETVYPAKVEPYRALPIAPGAEVRVSAPIALGSLPDYVQGVQIPVGRFPQMYREADQRYGPFLDRGHMFELWFDDRGRVVRMQHIFTP